MNVIAHNLTAMNAQRQFNISTSAKQKSVEKLSSGYRINRAADDAAGLSISEKMRGQIRGLSQGVENTQAGVSLCQVADGALAEVNDMLHRITELSVKSANGTNSASDRAAIQEEINQILSEIDRISDTTTFNGQPIFKDEAPASAVSRNVQDHVSTIQSSINVTSDGLTATDTSFISSGTISADTQGISSNGDSIPWSQITDENGNSLADTPIVGGNYSFTLFESNNIIDVKVDFSVNDGATLDDVIHSIDGMTYDITQNTYQPIEITFDAVYITPQTEAFTQHKPQFRADMNGLSMNGFPSIAWDEIGINIDNPGSQTGRFLDEQSGFSFSFTTAPNATMEDIITAFQQTSILITSSANGTNEFPISYSKTTQNTDYTVTSQYSFLTAEGMRALGFSVQDSHINASLSVKISGSDTSDLKVTISRDNGNSIEIPYSDWVINEKMNGFYGPRFESSYGTFNLYTSTINGNVISSPETALLSFIGSLDTLTTNGTISPIGALFSKESVPNGTTVDTTLPPHSSTSTITEIGANRTPNQVFIQSGCDTMDGIILEIDKMSTRSLGINDLNVSTLKGADKVIAIMDSALEKLSTNRSKIGAQQNRLEHTIANEDNTIENTTASESRIRDTDMAEEMVNYSMNNILSQAGQAMIAQANQSTQGILSLLQ